MSSITSINVTSKANTASSFGTTNNFSNSVINSEPQNYLTLTLTIPAVTYKNTVTEILPEFKLDNNEVLANCTDDLLWSVDTGFRLMAANNAFFKDLDDLISVRLKPSDFLLQKDMFTPELLTLWKRCYKKALSGRSFKVEIHVPKINRREESWTDTSFKPIYKNDVIVGVTCHSRNITEKKKAEVKIKLVKERLTAAQKVAKIGSWETNLKTQKVIWSDEIFKIFDIDQSACPLNHQHFITFVHPDDRNKVDAAFKNSLKNDAVNTIEFRIETGADSNKIVEAHWQIFRDDAGKPQRAAGTYQDITERKKSESRHRENELPYGSLIEQAHDAIFIADATLSIIDVNPSSCRLLGYSKEEFFNLTIADLFVTEDLIANSFRLNELFLVKAASNERRFKRKDGKSVDVELSAKMLEDGSVIMFGHDITERKIIGQKLKESNRLFNLICKATNDMVWDWDLLTGTVYRNNEGWKKLFKTKDNHKEAALINDWNERVHPEDKQVVLEVIEKIKNPDYSFFEVECRMLRDDGTYAYVHDRAHIIRNADGKAVRLIGATQDITQRKEAEFQVLKSEIQFRSLVQNSSDLTGILDDRGYFLYSSPSIKRILGYDSAFMIGKNVFSIVHPDDINILKTHLNKMNMGPEGQTEYVSFRFKNIEGEWRWLESKVADMSKNPEVQGYIFNARDVTERKIAEAEIEKLSMIARETTNAVIITDAAGKIVWVNEAFTTITEFEGHEVTGKKPGDFLHGEETNPAVVRILRNKIKKMVPFECDIVNYSKSGRKYWIRIQCQPLFGENGKLKNFFAVQTDITKEKEAEEILKKSEERYRYLFNNNPASILIWDIDTLKLLEVNDTAVRLYGYSRKEFLTKTVLNLRSKDKHAEIKKFAKTARENPGFKIAGVWKHLNNAGEEMFMEITSHRIEYKGRAVVMALGNNITQKVLLENELETERLLKQQEITQAVISAQEQERQELGSELHDNINQILAGSRLYLGLAQKELKINHSYFTEADSLLNTAITEIRNLSHSLIPPSLNDSELLGAIANIVKVTQQTAGIKITVQALGFDESKMGDKLKLAIYRIIQEQFNNIQKHAHAKNIILKLFQHAEKTVLSIKDDGIGFNPDKKAKGVGLINIKTRVSLFNGELSIISSPGKGCEIRVIFK